MSDETQLTSVTIRLTDINNITLQYTQAVPLNGKDFNFSIPYVLNEFHLASGSYYITLKANDGSNTTERSVQIYVVASPTVKTGYFWVGATQPKIIVRADANLVQQSTISLSTGFNGMAFGAYYQQLFINGNLNQAFVGYDAVMNGNVWTIPYNASGLPEFECVATDGQKAFIGYYGGTVSSVTNTGGPSTYYSAGNSNYYPYYFALTTSYALGAYKDRSGGSDRLYCYFRNSGVGTNNAFLPTRVLGIFEYSNTQMYIFGNLSSGQAAYWIYDVTLNGLSSPFVIPNGKLLSVVQAEPNYFLLALDDGKIYGYTNTTYLGGTYSVVANLRAQKLAYNAALRELTASSNTSLYSYSLSTNYALNLSSALNAGDSIIGFEVITNK